MLYSEGINRFLSICESENQLIGKGITNKLANPDYSLPDAWNELFGLDAELGDTLIDDAGYDVVHQKGLGRASRAVNIALAWILYTIPTSELHSASHRAPL